MIDTPEEFFKTAVLIIIIVGFFLLVIAMLKYGYDTAQYIHAKQAEAIANCTIST